MPTQDQINATDCRTIDSNDVNWRVGVQRGQPPGAAPMSTWNADDFASYIAVYQHCNEGKPYYEAFLTNLQTKAQLAAQLQVNAQHRQQAQMQAPAAAPAPLAPPQAGDPDYNAKYQAWANQTITRRTQQDQAFTDAATARFRAEEEQARLAQQQRPAADQQIAAQQAARGAEIRAQHTSGFSPATTSTNVAAESLREVTALSCTNVSENDPGWRQSVISGVAPGVSVLMSHWSPSAYDTYVSLVQQCTANSSYQYLNSLLTNLRGRAEGAHSLDAAYERMQRPSPRYVVDADADRQIFDRVTADAARIDAENRAGTQEASNLMSAIAQINARMAPQCKDVANVHALQDLIEQNREHVVMIYNPQPFGTTERGIAAARTFGLDALTGGVKLAATGSTVGTQIPSCVANVITAHSEQLWGYGWEQIDGQTIMNALELE